MNEISDLTTRLLEFKEKKSANLLVDSSSSFLIQFKYYLFIHPNNFRRQLSGGLTTYYYMLVSF